MAVGAELAFTLRGRDFQDEDPALRFSRLNVLAFVARLKRERPARIRITFDGSSAATTLLMELAGEIGGYNVEIEGREASFERV